MSCVRLLLFQYNSRTNKVVSLFFHLILRLLNLILSAASISSSLIDLLSAHLLYYLPLNNYLLPTVFPVRLSICPIQFVSWIRFHSLFVMSLTFCLPPTLLYYLSLSYLPSPLLFSPLLIPPHYPPLLPLPPALSSILSAYLSSGSCSGIFTACRGVFRTRAELSQQLIPHLIVDVLSQGYSYNTQEITALPFHQSCPLCHLHHVNIL